MVPVSPNGITASFPSIEVMDSIGYDIQNLLLHAARWYIIFESRLFNHTAITVQEVT